MKEEEILSAGIDIGTSTTQLVFSRMLLQNTGGFGRIPQIKVISKDVFYRSKVYFTPLLSRDEIDGEKVHDIIDGEYKKAGIKASDLSTGAVIITGESSRKKNAEDVVKAISGIAGDFVVATAGADLESVLAGKGSGAAQLSKDTGSIVANLDIGGGTSNICFFKNGHMLDTACLDIGGRLVQIQDGLLTYVAPKIRWLADKLELDIREGKQAEERELRILTDAMAEILAQSVGINEISETQQNLLEHMKTNHLISYRKKPEILTFSGGVAACFGEEEDVFRYGDIGILLAQAIRKNPSFQSADVRNARETMRATVIGAGNYSMDISGSTIEYTADLFPMKNIPVVRPLLERPEDIPDLDKSIHREMQLYMEKQSEDRQTAISMKGLKCPSFKQVQKIAEKIVSQYEKECREKQPLIVVFEEDIGKAVGQALGHRLKGKRDIICIDGIHCESGDFIDLGEPVASGTVIPAVVKTLIFNG